MARATYNRELGFVFAASRDTRLSFSIRPHSAPWYITTKLNQFNFFRRSKWTLRGDVYVADFALLGDPGDDHRHNYDHPAKHERRLKLAKIA